MILETNVASTVTYKSRMASVSFVTRETIFPPVNDQSTELATFEYEKNIFPHNLNNFVRRLLQEELLSVCK